MVGHRELFFDNEYSLLRRSLSTRFLLGKFSLWKRSNSLWCIGWSRWDSQGWLEFQSSSRTRRRMRDDDRCHTRLVWWVYDRPSARIEPVERIHDKWSGNFETFRGWLTIWWKLFPAVTIALFRSISPNTQIADPMIQNALNCFISARRKCNTLHATTSKHRKQLFQLTWQIIKLNEIFNPTDQCSQAILNWVREHERV